MTDHDDRLDELLREAAARDYHAPPAATPRDEMWERIAAARAARRAARDDGQAPPPITTSGDHETAMPGDDVVHPAPDVIVLPTRRRRWHSAAWARALAAALLVAVGIGVGRWSASHESAGTPSRSADSGKLAAANPPPTTRPTSSEVLRASSPDAGAATSASTQLANARTGSADRASRVVARRDDHRADDSTSPSINAESREPRAESREPALAYRLAAAQHLALTETLLATVSADARAGRADSSVSIWARDLLGTTRMLLDSPAARDPKMAQLLEDLELVLAELAQLHPTRGSDELRAIDRAVRQRGVLTRLRATMPAGPLSAGT